MVALMQYIENVQFLADPVCNSSSSSACKVIGQQDVHWQE